MLVCDPYTLPIIAITLCLGISGVIPIKIFSLVIIVNIYEIPLCAGHHAGWFLFYLYVVLIRNSCYSHFIDEEINP